MAKYLGDIVDYFEGLSTNHPDLLHDEAAGSRVFEPIMYEEAFSDFRTAGIEKGFFVRLMLPTITFSKHQNNAHKHYQCGLMVGKYYSLREDVKRGKVEAWADAERVADDFVARMVYDSRNGHELFNYSIDSISDLKLSGDYLDFQGDGSYAAVLYVFDFGTFRCLDPEGSGFANWLDIP